MRRLVLLSAVLSVLFVVPAPAATITLQITVSAGTHDRVNVPVCLPLTLPSTFARAESVVLQAANGKQAIGQLTGPSLLTESGPASGKNFVRRDAHFILRRLKAGTSVDLKIAISTAAPKKAESFAWHESKGHTDTELRFDERPVLRYMYRGLDDSSPQKREATYKVYHHLFDPEGKLLVTKGPGGLYTHHRGLFYGFRLIHYGNHKKPVDTWHCTGDTHQAHLDFLSSEAGPVLGRHRALIEWRGHKKEGFAREERELTVYNVPGGILVEFASRLRTTGGKVKLDGDPQHAGFQFRAAQEVAAKTSKETYYLRPDGAGKPGKTRNWPDDKGHVDLPWDAMSFVLGGQRYTAAYLDKPTNPKEARFSERDYGRFGSYFVYELTKDKPLLVNYRIWLQKGEMKGPQVAALDEDFVTPVGVKVK